MSAAGVEPVMRGGGGILHWSGMKFAPATRSQCDLGGDRDSLSLMLPAG